MATTAGEPHDRSPARTCRRVLLAEDDEAMRVLLATVLRDDGFEVIEAANGRELFWLIERASPLEPPIDVVVSDVKMPGYDGLEVTEVWTALGDAPTVILMSAFPDDDVRSRAAKLGVILLDKPFELATFLRIVREAGRRTETS